MTLHVTLFFIGLMALLQVPFTVMVGLYRGKTGIQFEGGGNPAMTRRMRAHANYTENVPITLLAMAAAEISGLGPAWLWVAGLMLLAGRIIHAYALIRYGSGMLRGLGMVLTVTPLALLAFYDILVFFA